MMPPSWVQRLLGSQLGPSYLCSPSIAPQTRGSTLHSRVVRLLLSCRHGSQWPERKTEWVTRLGV